VNSISSVNRKLCHAHASAGAVTIVASCITGHAAEDRIVASSQTMLLQVLASFLLHEFSILIPLSILFPILSLMRLLSSKPCAAAPPARE
jgi:hypothetical protein